MTLPTLRIVRFSIFVGGESKGPAKVTSQYSTTEAVSSNVTKTLNISDNDTAGLPSKKGKFEGAMRHLNSGVKKGCMESG